MLRQPGRACALLLACLLAAAPGLAATTEERTRFVTGNLEFLLIHELGHLVIAEYQVPVLGPEEVAADYVAIAALIRRKLAGGERGERARDYLFAAAAALNASWERGEAAGAQVPYWGAHALNIQRFYQIGCLVYGSDPEAYPGLPARIGLPAARAAGCAAEYAQAARSFEWLIATYGRKAGEPPGPPMTVDYQTPRSRAERELLARIVQSGSIEFTLDRLQQLFRLRAPARLVLRNCGRPEAAWQGATRELVVCYELLDTFWQLSARAPVFAPAAAAR